MKKYDIVSVPSRGILFPNGNWALCCWHWKYRVSVPSRGILFPNTTISSWLLTCRWVSVPSRGILFPNFFGYNYTRGWEFEKEFPSPLGVSYFQISICLYGWKGGCWMVSVPSRGILFPNNMKLLYMTTKDGYMFPSPLGVSYFQILWGNGWLSFNKSCFRPLSGYLISKSIKESFLMWQRL